MQGEHADDHDRDEAPTGWHVDLVEVDRGADLQRRIAVVRAFGDDLLVEIAAADDAEVALVKAVVVAHREAAADDSIEGLGEGRLLGDWLLGIGPHDDGDCPFAEGEVLGTAPG
jgi:hypothetical protein